MIQLFLLILIIIPLNLWAVLNEPLRPRISDLMKERYPFETTEYHVPYAANHLNPEKFFKTLEKDGIHFFIRLQQLYPDATYAFLGRDTQLIADYLDALFISIGQPGRVVQIASSKSTLDGLTNTEIVKYLKDTTGFNIKKIKSERPFILIDTVSRGGDIQTNLGSEIVSGRQARAILEAVYSYWTHEMGNNPVDLIDKFNFLGLQVSTFDTTSAWNNERYIQSPDSLSSIQLKNKKRFKQQFDRFGFDMTVPLLSDTRGLFNESGYDHYTGAWHGKFQHPQTNTRGHFLPTPGPLTQEFFRRNILWMQYKIIDLVNSVGFQQKLMDQTKQYGLELFPRPKSCVGFFIRR